MFKKRLPPNKKQLLRGQSLDSHTFQVLLKTGVRRADNTSGASSVTLTSCSEESSDETNGGNKPVARRGRRDAVFDNKNLGEESPVVSADESCSQRDDDGHTFPRSVVRRRRTRRRSSVLEPLKLHSSPRITIHPVNIAGKTSKVLRRQHTVANIVTPASPQKTDDTKKHKHAFSLFRLNLMKVKEKEETVTRLVEILQGVKLTEFKDAQLVGYKESNWTDLIVCSDKQEADAIDFEDAEIKRRGAVWELFQSECSFLVDRLMVLKHCFLETLKSVQVEGYLMYIESADLFGNIEEICYVSYKFCKEFIADLLTDMSMRPSDFGRTEVLIRNISKLSHLSQAAGVYHTYCLNYQNALNYLENLRQNKDFRFFEKWCEQDNRCKRLQLSDLLVAPVQRCTKLPLLIQAVRHYTYDVGDNSLLLDSIHALSQSLKTLEDKIAWLKNYERIHEIQNNLVWPSVRDLDHKAFIPDFIRPVLNETSSRLFSSPSRCLLHEGPVLLVDSTKLHDMYMFLFDDVLLLTKCKKSIRKSTGSDLSHRPHPMECTSYHIHRQPIPLEDLSLYDVVSPELSVSSMTNALVLVHTSRFEQVIAVLTLQTNNLPSKEVWLSKIQEAKEKLQFTSRCTLAADATSCLKHPKTKLPRKLSNRDVILIPYNVEADVTCS